MRDRFPPDVALCLKDLALLERVFAQVVPEHDTPSEALSMLLVRLFQEGMRHEQDLLSAAEKSSR